MNSWRLAIVASISTLLLMACGPSKAQIQEMAVDTDLMLEFRYIPNDSIGIRMGNMLVLNTAKTSSLEDFYPLLVSTRSMEDIDKPTATHALQNDAELLQYVRSGQEITRFGVVISETCAKDPAFSEMNAIALATRLAQQVPGSTLMLFREKGGDIVDGKKLKLAP